MNTLKETSLSGVAILLLGGTLPFLDKGDYVAAIIAGSLGLALLAGKYFLRGKSE